MPWIAASVVLLSALLVMAALTSAWWRERQQATERLHGELAALAALSAAAQQRALDVSHQLVLTLARLGALGGDWESCNALLADIGPSQNAFVSINVVDGDGVVRCSSVPAIGGVSGGISMQDRPYVREARATGRLAVGELVVGRVTRRWTLPLAVPLAKGGSADGARDQRLLVPGIDLLGLTTHLGHIALPDGITLHVLDRAGRVAASAGPGATTVGELYRAMPAELLSRALVSTRPDLIEHADASPGGQATRLRAALHPVLIDRQLAVLVVASASLDTLAAQANRGIAEQLALLGLIYLAVLGGVGAVVYRWVVQPIRGLAAQLPDIGRQGADAQVRPVSSPVREVRALHAALLQLVVALGLRQRERDRALAESGAAREGMQEILSRMDDGFVVLDRDACVSYANARALDLFSASDRPLAGGDFWQQFPDGGTGLREEAARELAAGRPWVWEDYLPSARRWLDVRMYTSDSECAVFLRDSTERWQMLQALRQRERIYRELFDANPRAMLIFDEDSLAVLAINDAALALYGLGREAALASTVLDLTPEADREAMQTAIARARAAAAGRQRSLRQQGRIWRQIGPDGQSLLVEAVVHRLFFEERPAWLAMITPAAEQLTERAAWRHELAQLRQQHQALQHEHDAWREVELLLSVLLSARVVPALDAVLHDRGDRAGTVALARAARELVSDVLRLGDTGRDALAIGTIDVSAVTQQAARAVSMRHAGQTLPLDIAPGLQLRGDARQLGLALELLIEHAWLALGVQADGWIRISQGPPDATLGPVLLVSDNALNHDPAFLDGRLFRAFDQATDLITPAGLRLTAARLVVQRHGGSLHVSHDVGSPGAVVQLTLAPPEDTQVISEVEIDEYRPHDGAGDADRADAPAR